MKCLILKKIMMSTKKLRISIVGCGWLGKPLFNILSNKYEVSCFTRKKDESNLNNHYLNPSKDSDFWNCDYAIIAISTKDNYLETLRHIALHVEEKATVILTSSISVYREYDCEVDEKTPITTSNKQYEAEILMQSLRKKLIILRLGGLMGEDRIAGAWRGSLSFKDGPVNYVHRDDAIGVIEKIISHSVNSGIFNVVAPIHPMRLKVHRKNSKKFGFKEGVFDGINKRIVNSTQIKKLLKYNFKYPNPLNFW